MTKLLSLFGGLGLTQYLIAALAVAILGATALGFVVKHQIGVIAVQKTALSGLTAALDRARLAERRAGKAIVARDKKIAQIAAKSAAEKRTLEAALRLSRPWADQPVPKEVQDAIQSSNPTVDAPDDHPHCVLWVCKHPDSGPGEGEDTPGVDPGLPDHLGEYRNERGTSPLASIAPPGPPEVQRGQGGITGLERFGIDLG